MNSAVVVNPKKKEMVYCFHTAITLILMFGFGFLPVIEPITPLGMKIVGILLGLLYGWTTVGLMWPSIFGTLATALSGGLTIKETLIAGYGSDITILIIFIFIFAAIVEEAGVSKFIAMWFVTRKVFFGKPWAFSFILLFAAFLLSASTSTVAAIIICWGIIYRISKELGFKPGDKWPALMVLGVVYACTLGLSLFPYKSVPLVVLGTFSKISGMEVVFLNYVCFTLPICILSIILYTLLAKFVFRPNVTPLIQLNADTMGEDAKLGLNKNQKIIIGFLLSLIILLLVPSLLPKTWFLAKILNGIGATGTVMLIVGIMVCVRMEGKPLLNFKEMASKGMQWDVVVLTATVLPFVGVLTSDATGVTPFLTNVLTPIFAGKPGIIFMGLVVLLAVILTNLCNNGVTGVILVTITYGFSVQMGINPVVLAMLVVYSVHLAVLTPAASPMAAVLHGNREWISAKEIYFYGGIAVLLTGVLLVVVGIPLGNMLF